jgi:PAS domain S-box-containing protein
MIWMAGPDRQCNYFNRAWLEFTGRSLETELGWGWASGVHPEDLSKCLEAYSKSVERREPFEREYRLRRHDGEYRWIFDQGVPRIDADGSLAGYIGSGIDITERRAAQEALSTVNQRLMEGLEQERARLARELHDDILQQLTLLKVRLDALRQAPVSPAEVQEEIGQVSRQIGECVEDVQALSHRLHSSKLEFLGLPAAAAGFCEEFSDRQHVKIDFQAESIPEGVPPAIGLCVFRLMQEAVQNATKHSGARRFQVSLRGAVNEIELTVGDSGAGFDLKEAMRGRGVGLVSMKERVKLVDGQLFIDSKPGRGTTIHARVPLGGRANRL